MPDTHTATNTSGALGSANRNASRFPVDLEAFTAIQQANLQLLTDASLIALNGAQMLLRRQGELIRETNNEIASIIAEMAKPETSVAGRLSAQIDGAKRTIERGFANTRDLTWLVAQINADALETITRCANEAAAECCAHAARQPTSLNWKRQPEMPS